MSRNKGAMTVAEAGRRGGATTAPPPCLDDGAGGNNELLKEGAHSSLLPFR